jgi:DNA-binding beta-propeller fold protein YncE
VLAFGTSSALASQAHGFAKSFGEGELALGSQSNLAINQESGEVYVADTGNSRVAKFTAAGVADGSLATITEPTFIAVDNSSGSSKGDVYVVDSSDNSIVKLDALGLPVSGWGTAGRLGGLGTIAGIAVDSSGDLWAYNDASLMRKFSGSSGMQLSTEWQVAYGVSTRGIAVDSKTNLYVVRGAPLIAQYTEAGVELESSFGKTETTSLAVDESNDDLYLGTENSVVRVNSSKKIIETFGRSDTRVHYASGTAVRVATGDVYVANAETDVVSVFSFENVEPPSATIESPVPGARTAHFSGHINPNAPGGSPPPSYDVIWRFECEPGCPGVEGEISADSTEHLVEGTAQGLEPHTNYKVTLIAANVGNTVETGSVVFTTLPDKPFANAGFVTGVTDTEAILNATVIPNGGATTYHFDYVTQAAFEAEGGFEGPQVHSTPEEDLLPVDNEGHAVATRLTGLVPHTAYVYRVVATNSVGSAVWPTQEEEEGGLIPSFATQGASPAPETDCPNQAFREFAGALLPDCRAYEQASPVDKGGLNVEGIANLLAASSDGSAVTFYSQGGTGIPASGGAHQEYTTLLASRQGESWSIQRLLPPEELAGIAGFVGASQDLGYALLEAERRGPTVSTNGLYIANTSDGSLAQIISREGPTGSRLGNYAYDSISADGSRVFFETRYQLTPNAAPERINLYMWDRATGKVSLVGVLPGVSEEGPVRGSFGGAYDWYLNESTNQGGSLAGLYVEAIHAISPDGDQAYFTAGSTGYLYLRRGLSGPTPTTVKVSKANEGVVDPWVEEIGEEYPAAFQEATPDGSRAFFLSSQKLTADATTGETDEGKDLYRYDTKTESLVDITPDPSDFNGAQVQGLLGASADGSSGYFVARGVLADGGQAGENNIYRFSEEGGNLTLTFVASFEGSRRNWSPQTFGGAFSEPEASISKISRVSADGQVLLFESGGQFQVYSAGNESLNCISCNPSGEQSVAAPLISTDSFNANFYPDGATMGRVVRSMSADGSRVFFQTPDSLVPGDTNGQVGCKFSRETPFFKGGTPYCQDVYEWEAPGAPGGSCQKAELNGGCIYLLSSGTSKNPSFFVDASTDGSSAFIATDSQLVPADKDELYDVYNVRTGGGLASQHVIPPTPCASGEACHGSSSLAPDVSSPGTSSFQGPGNPKSGKTKAKKCKKSANSNCAKKKHKKKHRKKSAKRPNATTRKAGGSK